MNCIHCGRPMQSSVDTEGGIKFRMWHCPHCMHLEFETIGRVVCCRYCKNLSNCRNIVARAGVNLDVNCNRGGCAGFQPIKLNPKVKPRIEPEKVVFT